MRHYKDTCYREGYRTLRNLTLLLHCIQDGVSKGISVYCNECVVRLLTDPQQSKKGDGVGEGELRKYEGAGQDSDLVEALERDIVSRNPNIHWYDDRTRERTTHCFSVGGGSCATKNTRLSGA